jgi:hypothetical protein
MITPSKSVILRVLSTYERLNCMTRYCRTLRHSSSSNPFRCLFRSVSRTSFLLIATLSIWLVYARKSNLLANNIINAKHTGRLPSRESNKFTQDSWESNVFDILLPQTDIFSDCFGFYAPNSVVFNESNLQIIVFS